MVGQVIHHASSAFNLKFTQGVESASPDYIKIATVVPSTAASTGYGFLGEFPMLKEWVGERDVKQLATHEYALLNKLFEASISVPRTDFEDNDYGKYGVLFEEMGRNGAEYPDEYVYGLLTNGTTELCYDGQPFFSADHPVGEKTISNLCQAASNPGPKWYLLDVSRALKPLLWQERLKPKVEFVTANGAAVDDSVFMSDKFKYGVRARGNAGYTMWQMAACSDKPLDEASFAEAYDAMFAIKADNGRPLRIRPSVIVVPPSLRQKAIELFKREYLASGESNPNYQLVDIIVSPWLT